MNWKLVLMLSGFGVVMALGTVFVIPPAIEPVVWLAIFVACAIVIARSKAPKPFLHGFAVSVVNSVWVTAAHVAFFDTYMGGHPREAAMSAGMSSPRLMMIVTGPIVGIVSGLVLGLFAFVAAKITSRRAP
jgi:hypothetical protein